MALVQQQNGVDVTNTVKKGEDSRLVDPEAVLATEEKYKQEQAALAAAARPPRRPGPFGFGPAGPGVRRPPRRPSGGLFGLKFPFF